MTAACYIYIGNELLIIYVERYIQREDWLRACSHSRLKSELFPTLGSPTIPIFKLFFTRPNRAPVFSGGASFLGGIALLPWKWVPYSMVSLCDRLR